MNDKLQSRYMAENKSKRESLPKSLSMIIGNQIISVSEFGTDKFPNPPNPCEYLLMVTRPGTDNEHIAIVIKESAIHRLIDMLETIVCHEESKP